METCMKRPLGLVLEGGQGDAVQGVSPLWLVDLCFCHLCLHKKGQQYISLLVFLMPHTINVIFHILLLHPWSQFCHILYFHLILCLSFLFGSHHLQHGPFLSGSWQVSWPFTSTTLIAWDWVGWWLKNSSHKGCGLRGEPFLNPGGSYFSPWYISLFFIHWPPTCITLPSLVIQVFLDLSPLSYPSPAPLFMLLSFCFSSSVCSSSLIF